MFLVLWKWAQTLTNLTSYKAKKNTHTNTQKEKIKLLSETSLTTSGFSQALQLIATCWPTASLCMKHPPTQPSPARVMNSDYVLCVLKLLAYFVRKNGEKTTILSRFLIPLSSPASRFCVLHERFSSTTIRLSLHPRFTIGWQIAFPAACRQQRGHPLPCNS